MIFLRKRQIDHYAALERYGRNEKDYIVKYDDGGQRFPFNWLDIIFGCAIGSAEKTVTAMIAFCCFVSL